MPSAKRSDTPIKAAKRAGLVYVSDAEPGIRRVRSGRGFAYRRPRGGRVRDARTLARIRSLAIPPAYTDVWICPDPRGHIQATGRDARGRKQYRYHPDWSAERGAGKFDRAIAFGKALPKLRRRVRADLKLPGFPRDKVCAIVLAVLAETMIRVGNDEYARQNGSFGLTTLRDRHVEFLRGGRARFRFRGKSGQSHEVVLDDARLAKLVRDCQQLPGQTLFQYRDENGKRCPMSSTLVNAYLREAMGEEFTAKDFRTYAGTLAVFRLLARTPLPPGRRGHPPGESAFAAAEKTVVCQVAAALGNTPAVCRKAYVDPVVFDAWRSGALADIAVAARSARQWEQIALRFLARAHRSS
jgi:DNA topoisomerase IB